MHAVSWGGGLFTCIKKSLRSTAVHQSHLQLCTYACISRLAAHL